MYFTHFSSLQATVTSFQLLREREKKIVAMIHACARVKSLVSLKFGIDLMGADRCEKNKMKYSTRVNVAVEVESEMDFIGSN